VSAVDLASATTILPGVAQHAGCALALALGVRLSLRGPGDEMSEEPDPLHSQEAITPPQSGEIKRARFLAFIHP
jgi:hypothetical protein